MEQPDGSGDIEKQEKIEGCYCGEERNLNTKELRCAECLQWIHMECSSTFVENLLPFTSNYVFMCKRCHPDKMEVFQRRQASFTQMCVTTVANLMIRNPTERTFSKERDIVPFMEQHWEALNTMPRKTRNTWHATVMRTLTKESDLFLHIVETPGDDQFALRHPDLKEIKPNYEFFKLSDLSLAVATADVPFRSRASKRKTAEANVTTPVPQRTRRGETGTPAPTAGTSASFALLSQPSEYPYNKDGFRYFGTEKDPHAASGEEGEGLGRGYRVRLGDTVQLSHHDKAPQLKLSDDKLSVEGYKGYSMIRATHCVNRGTWYYEATIDSMPASSATRIGWAQRYENLQANCGHDKFGYSIRSHKGTAFHDSYGKTYALEGYTQGDVMGFMISLEPPTNPEDLLLPNLKDANVITFKSHHYFETKDSDMSSVRNNLKKTEGNKITFFKNGVNLGVAYTETYEGWFYPCVSLFKNAMVSMNFGPDFKYPPKVDYKFQPMSERATEAMVEYELGDLVANVVQKVDGSGKVPQAPVEATNSED